MRASRSAPSVSSRTKCGSPRGLRSPVCSSTAGARKPPESLPRSRCGICVSRSIPRTIRRRGCASPTRRCRFLTGRSGRPATTGSRFLPTPLSPPARRWRRSCANPSSSPPLRSGRGSPTTGSPTARPAKSSPPTRWWCRRRRRTGGFPHSISPPSPPGPGPG